MVELWREDLTHERSRLPEARPGHRVAHGVRHQRLWDRFAEL